MLSLVLILIMFNYGLGWALVSAETRGYTSRDTYKYLVFPTLIFGLLGGAVGMLVAFLVNIIHDFKDSK